MTQSSPDPDYPHRPPSPLWAGLMALCPACGKGKLYSGVLEVSKHCSHCGLPLAEHDAGDGPAYIVMCIMLLVTMVGAAMVEAAFAPPLWVHILIWFPLILIGSVWLLRVVKAVLISYDVRYRCDQYKQ